MTFKERLAAIPVVGTLMAVQKRTKADAADQFGAAIAFHGFISLFPLIAVAVAVAGWLLADQPEQIENVVNTIQQAIPGLDTQAIDGVMDGIIANAGSIGLIGFLGALYTGMRITNAAQTATQFVFGVPLEKVNALKARGQQLGSLVLLGFMALASVAVSAWVQAVVLSELQGPFSDLVPFGAWLASAALSVLLFWTAYRIYSAGADLGWRPLLPGALTGGVGWAALQYFGGSYLARQADSSVLTEDGSSATAVLLATMIGLMLLFYLAGRLYVYGAELSAVLAGVPDRAHREEETQHEATPVAAPVPARVGATEHTSGDQQGLLAALTAHEQRRGLPSQDDTGSLFPVAGQHEPAAPDDHDDSRAHPASDGATSAGSTAATSGDEEALADEGPARGRAGSIMGSGLLAGRRRRRGVEDGADSASSDGGDDDLVVTIGHEPDPSTPATSGEAAAADADIGRGLAERDAPWAATGSGPSRALASVGAATAGQDPMTRALVPFGTPDLQPQRSLLQDPTARRVAAATAVGLVGVAVGALRWRRQA